MRRRLLAVCLVITGWSALHAAELATVGELGDPARWGFTGDRTYNVADLRSAVAGDFEVLLASRPQAPRDRLVAVVGAAIERGYRSKGHPDPRIGVSVTPTGDRLICDIAAGRQYVNGRIDIRGANRIRVDDLRDALMKAPPSGITVPAPIPGLKTTATGQAVEGHSIPSNVPLWIPGERSAFTPFARAFGRQGVINALRRIGWFEPTLDVAFRPEADGTTTLVVDIADEGVPAVIGEIEILGLVRNSRERLIEHLGLAAGQPLTAAVEADLRRQLVACNRFLKSSVEVVPPPFGGNAPCKLILSVTESPYVPVIGEELTTLQQRALRAAASMPALQDSDWELSVRFLPKVDGESTTIVRLRVSGREGLALLECLSIDAEGRVRWNPRVLADERRIVLVSGNGRSKLEYPLTDSQVSCSLTIATDPKNAESGSVSLGFGLKTRSADLQLPIVTTVSMEPLAAIQEVSQAETTQEDVGEETIIRHKAKVLIILIIDRQTDEFREMTGEGKGDYEGSIISVSCRPGRLGAAWLELMAEVDRAEPALMPDLPITSLARFVLAEARELLTVVGDSVPPDLDLWDRLFAARTFESLDRWALSRSQPREQLPNRFTIPPTWSERPGPRTPEWLNFGVKWAWTLYSQAIPRDTPLWVMGREAMFLVLRPPGVTPATPMELATLLRDAHAGPVHFAIAAAAFGRLHPAYRVVLADAGLDVLDRPAYQRELEFLLDHACPVGQLVRSVALAMRDVDDADVAQLTARLGPPVQQAAVELRQRGDEPIETVILDIAGRLWDPVAKPFLEGFLRRLTR
jgi:hypothetical protein